MIENEDKVANTLSNEQLLDYVKKQKARIKRLEKEKETLTKLNSEQRRQIEAGAQPISSSLSDDSSLFWGLIERESLFKQKLATTALNHLVSTVSNSSLGRRCLPSRRSLFDRWRDHIIQSKIMTLSGALLDSNKSFAALEQKSAKLKALLARTHQSNQRFQEDSTSFKKIQKDAALQLKTLKERDESERSALLETVRARNIETAFQYDMELAIQRAADGMTQSQLATGAYGSSSNLTPKKYLTLEIENDSLNSKLEKQEVISSELKEEFKKIKKQYEKLEKEFISSQETILNLNKKILEYANSYEEDERLKRDLELELDLVTKGRAEIIKNMEVRYRDKNITEINALKTELMSLKNHSVSTTDYKNASIVIAKKNDNDDNNNNIVNSIDDNDKLLLANIEIRQLKTIISNLKTPSKNSSFLQSYSASSSLIPGMIPLAPKNNKLPNGTVSNIKGSGIVVGFGDNSSTGKNKNIERRWSISDASSANCAAPPESTPSQDRTTSYICESLLIKASNDFRLIIPIPTKKSFCLKWDFSIRSPMKIRSKGSTVHSDSSLDIGFSVIEKLSNGSLPQIIHYSRIKGSSRQTVIFRIETEGGEHTGIQKKIEKEERNTRTNIQSNNISQIPESGNIDGVIPMIVKVSDENIMEFEEDTNQSTDLFETSSELNGIDKNYSDSHTDSEEDSFRQMIVLFDNSYSWYRAKELKYSITVEILG